VDKFLYLVTLTLSVGKKIICFQDKEGGNVDEFDLNKMGAHQVKFFIDPGNSALVSKCTTDTLLSSWTDKTFSGVDKVTNILP
jgi:hypothetical protein